jgi:hypothetical protein
MPWKEVTAVNERMEFVAQRGNRKFSLGNPTPSLEVGQSQYLQLN